MDKLNELCKNHPDWQAVANMAYALGYSAGCQDAGRPLKPVYNDEDEMIGAEPIAQEI
jgi:hypothetical protein